MIKNFETVKTQLSELASVINSFKSEAVQLRTIELVLGAPRKKDIPDEGDEETTPQRKPSRRRRVKNEKGEQHKESKKRRAASGAGAVATLSQLAETAFFNKSRTINDIIQHCKHKLARAFKANEFSSKLGRMVRNGELNREKNADNQYEYKKP
jgi:hypothetical protein